MTQPPRTASLQATACVRPHARMAVLPGLLVTIWPMVLVLLLLLGGCANPGPPLAHRAPLQPAALGALEDATTPWPARDWWTAWGDPELDRLVALALEKEPTLLGAQARLQQARAAAQAAGALDTPLLGLQASATDQRYTAHGLIPPPLAGSVRWSADLRLAASWELDLFGAQRATLEAAIGRWRAAQADRQAARVLLASQVAGAYVALARALEAGELGRQALRQREHTQTLLRARQDAGLDNAIDLRQAQAALAQSRVELQALDAAAVQARHALAELCGQGPQALDALAPRLARVRAMCVPSVLPAQLVGRRADLVAQRWRVEAALQDVQVARARFYPNLNLMAFVGLNSLGLDQLVNAGSRVYGAGPALSLPLFESARLHAEQQARDAAVDGAIQAYDASLLRALREVADEAAALQSNAAQQRGQAQALQAAEAAWALARQRHAAGLGNLLPVLQAEAGVIAQRRAALDLRARQLGAEAALARALGGGYDSGQNALGSHDANQVDRGADDTHQASAQNAAQATP